MPRSPLALAALATVAVPGLDAFDVRSSALAGGDLDAAVVLDAEGRRWVVRAPRTAKAGAALELEVTLLAALAARVDAGDLPFDVPRVAGSAPLPEGGRAVVHRQLPGRRLQMELLGPGPGLAAELGRAIAAIHELPPAVVEDAGLPVYEADEYRRRRLSEVDEAARTGRVPAGLLRRWERVLEDVSIWRFQPTVVHGDLTADHVLCSREAPTAVLSWTEAKIADPADDLAWLLVAAPEEAVDPILEAYSMRRSAMLDRHLADRALLAGELALARWLLHGVRTGDETIIEDATAMLVELDEQTSRYDDDAATHVTEEAPEDAGTAEPEDTLESGAGVEPDDSPKSEDTVATDGAAGPAEAGLDDAAHAEPTDQDLTGR